MDPLHISERVCARPVGPRWESRRRRRLCCPPFGWARTAEGGEDIPATFLRHPSDISPDSSHFHPTSVRHLSRLSDFRPTSLQTLQTSVRHLSDFDLIGMRLAKVAGAQTSRKWRRRRHLESGE
jgi:hypothetical protein